MSGPFYDSDVLRRYLEHRGRPDNPNDAIEAPAFRNLAGDLTGLDIIDLGCGDASFGREALEAGANSYLGLEISSEMAALAEENLSDLNGRVEHAQIEQWHPLPESADLVTSRLALNYVEHLAPVLDQVRRALRSQGRLLISVEHPVITSSFSSLAGGRRTNWLVDDYFRTGARPHEWLGREVVKYHRTLNDYLDLLEESDLRLERLRESRPQRGNFRSGAEYERRLRIPLFLFIAARKPE